MSEDRAPSTEGRDETPSITTEEVAPIAREEGSTAPAPGPAALPVAKGPRGKPDQTRSPAADEAAGLESTKVKVAAAGGTGLLAVLVKGTLSLLGKFLGPFVSLTMALGAFAVLVVVGLSAWLLHEAYPRVTRLFGGRPPDRAPEPDDAKLSLRLPNTGPSEGGSADIGRSPTPPRSGGEGVEELQSGRAPDSAGSGR